MASHPIPPLWFGSLLMGRCSMNVQTATVTLNAPLTWFNWGLFLLYWQTGLSACISMNWSRIYNYYLVLPLFMWWSIHAVPLRLLLSILSAYSNGRCLWLLEYDGGSYPTSFLRLLLRKHVGHWWNVRLLQITHQQLTFCCSCDTVHLCGPDGLTSFLRSCLAQRCGELLWTDPSTLLEEDQYLLDLDFAVLAFGDRGNSLCHKLHRDGPPWWWTGWWPTYANWLWRQYSVSSQTPPPVWCN